MNTELSDYLDKAIAEFSFIPKQKEYTPKLEMSDIPNIDLPWNHEGFYYNINLQLNQKLFASLMPDKQFIAQTGKFYYPPGGFMGWHTNSGHEGYRIYATRCKESNKSFFRYLLDGEMHTEWEQVGWNCRLFEVRKDKLYWHCVWSDTDRYSFGFRFTI